MNSNEQFHRNPTMSLNYRQVHESFMFFLQQINPIIVAGNESNNCDWKKIIALVYKEIRSMKDKGKRRKSKELRSMRRVVSCTQMLLDNNVVNSNIVVS